MICGTITVAVHVPILNAPHKLHTELLVGAIPPCRVMKEGHVSGADGSEGTFRGPCSPLLSAYKLQCVTVG